MVAFLVDEDLPIAVVRALRGAGHDALHVRDAGLQGEPDSAVHELSIAQGRVLVTADLGLANPHLYSCRFGIVLVRLPNTTPAPEIAARIGRAVAALGEGGFAGNVVVIDAARVRVRRTGT